MKQRWQGLNRLEKLASCIYSDLVDPSLRREMSDIARREGKQIKGSGLLKDSERGCVSKLGGKAR